MRRRDFLRALVYGVGVAALPTGALAQIEAWVEKDPLAEVPAGVTATLDALLREIYSKPMFDNVTSQTAFARLFGDSLPVRPGERHIELAHYFEVPHAS